MTTRTHLTENSLLPSSKGKGGRGWLSRGACSGLALLLGVSTVVSPLAAADSGETSPALPSFLFQPFYASNEGSVYGIFEARHADLVLLEGGYDSGFRTGMVCRVADGERAVGEVMLVDVRNNCAAAVILELNSGQVIEPGHSVRIKTVKF